MTKPSASPTSKTKPNSEGRLKHDPGQLVEQSRTFLVAALLSLYAAALSVETTPLTKDSDRLWKWPLCLGLNGFVLVVYVSSWWRAKRPRITRSDRNLTILAFVLLLPWLLFIIDKWGSEWTGWKLILVVVGGALLLVCLLQTLLLLLCMFKQGFDTDHRDLVNNCVRDGAWASLILAPFVLLTDAFLILTDIRTSSHSLNQTANHTHIALPDWLTLTMLFLSMAFVTLNSMAGAWALRRYSEPPDTRQVMTVGFSRLTPQDQEEVERRLQIDAYPFSRHHTEDGYELIITEVKTGVLITDLPSYLAQFHVTVTDYHSN